MNNPEESIILSISSPPGSGFNGTESQARRRKTGTSISTRVVDEEKVFDTESESKKTPFIGYWNKIILTSCVISVLSDPLFFYIPIIKEESKCVAMDKKLRNVTLLLRSLTDFISVLDILYQIRSRIVASGLQKTKSSSSLDSTTPENEKKDAIDVTRKLRRLSLSIIVHLLAIVPLPQVSILVVFLRMSDSGYFQKRMILNIFLLFQYVPNIYPLHLSYKKLDTTARWVKGAFNFFLYIIASHVLGAFWYFFSIQRETLCWNQACTNIKGCVAARCDDNVSVNVTLLNGLCPINPPNATLFDFGMFLDTLQSGYTGQISFPTKFFYSFWWALKNLSNFGTNLETSSYIWENCFAILISLTGLLLFLYLIGNVQAYMQFSKSKEMKEEELKERIRTKEKDIRDYLMLRNGLPDHMRIDIMTNIKQDVLIRKIDCDVDMDFLFSLIPWNIKSSITRYLSMNALKKVPMLKHMDVQVLEAICEHLQLVTYTSKSYVFQAGKELDLMLFITEGIISTEEPSSHDKLEFFGEEILMWVSPSISFSDLRRPTSTENVKCHTKVEGFALTTKDLQIVVSGKHRRLWNRGLYNCDINYQELEELARPPDSTSQELNQTYMQLWDEQIRSGQNMKIMKDILDWVSGHGLHEDVKTQIKKHMKQNKVVLKKNIAGDVDVDFLFSILPPSIKRDIQDYFGINALQKVPMLQNMPGSTLESICRYLEPVTYSENRYIVRAGEPLDMMLFIIKGEIIWTNMTSFAATTGPFMITKLCLEKGDIFGEKLLSWAASSSSLSNLPTSVQDFKCETKVEAFSLQASQFQEVVSQLGSQWTTYYIKPPQDKTYLQILNEVYMQLTTSQLEKVEDEELKEKMKIMKKERDILEWLSRNGLHDDVKTDIMKYIKEKNVVEKDIDSEVDVKYLLSIDLPLTVERSLRHYLCMNTLKKVPMLENMIDDVLVRMCYHLQPVIYNEHNVIVQAGEQLDFMLIIIEGVIICTDMASNTATGSSVVTKSLEKGGFYGEELLYWASPKVLFSGAAPISTQHVKCQRKVEGFSLTSSNLRAVVSEYSIEWTSKFNDCNVQHLENESEEELTILNHICDQIPNEEQLGSTQMDQMQLGTMLVEAIQSGTTRVEEMQSATIRVDQEIQSGITRVEEMQTEPTQVDQEMQFVTTRVDEEIQSGTLRVEEIEDEELRLKVRIKKKEKDIREWLSRNVLDEVMKKKILIYIKVNNVVEKNIDADVDLSYLLSIKYPRSITISLKEHLCMSSLSTLTYAINRYPCLRVENMPEDVLGRIVYHLEPVIYTKDSHIAQTGNPVEFILIIIEGILMWTETASSSAGTTGPSAIPKCLNFYGKELLNWASPNILFSGAAPVWNRNVRCETKVEAFALTTEKLRTVVSEYSIEWMSNFNNSSILEQKDLTLPPDIIDQTSMQSGTEKLENIDDSEFQRKMKMKEQDILEWVSRNICNEDLKTKLMFQIKVINVVEKHVDADVDVKSLLSFGLPTYTENSIRRNICMRTLNNVPMLQCMHANLLEYIWEEVKPVIYTENSFVVRAGETLDFMLIIIEGGISNTTSEAGTTGSSVISTCFEKGDLYGEELLVWASPHILFSGDAPISTQDMKCQTKVEAFLLTADKLKQIILTYPNQWIEDFNNCNNSHLLESSLTLFDGIDQKLNEVYNGTTKLDKVEDEVLRHKMKIMIKEKEVLKWASRNGLSEEIKTKIMVTIKVHNAVEKNIDADVDVKYLCDYLPGTIHNSIKQHICIRTLKKVPMLESMLENVFVRMCNYIVPVTYAANSIVLRAGEPLHLMLIIVEGVIALTETDKISNASVITKRLQRGDFYGEGLLSWASPSISFSGSTPVSTQDVKCETKVEAFALTADKFGSVVSEFSIEWMSDFYDCKNSPLLEDLTIFQDKIFDQMFLQMGTTKVEGMEDEESQQEMDMMIKETDILQWVLRNGGSGNLKTQIMTRIKEENLVERTINEDTDVNYFHHNLPLSINCHLRRHLCMNTLKMVPMLRDMPDCLFEAMCEDFLHPVIYTESSIVVGAGQPLNSMLIIIEGVIECMDVINDAGTTTSMITKCLGKGELYGEELLSWASPPILFSGCVPISTRDVKCRTKVEAFTLTTENLRSLVSEFSIDWISNFNTSNVLEELTLVQDKIDQAYMQLRTAKVEEIEDQELRKRVKIKIKENEILEWASKYILNEDLKTKFMFSIKVNNVAEKNIDADVDVKLILSDLPFMIKTSITKRLCISTLRKVPGLQNIDIEVLDEMFYDLEPAIYTENSYVVRAGEPIELMLVIIEGKLTCTEISNDDGAITGSSSICFEKGDLYGQELLNWAASSFSDPQPLWTRDAKCQTKVEAFALKVYELRKLVSEISSQWISNFKNCNN